MDWSIQPRSHVCQACGHAFRAKEVLHTLLFDERQEYHRLDICEACWTAQYAEGANHRRGFVSHWVSVHVPPEPAPAEPIRRETAETLLRRLVERDDPAHAPACFILAVMLERKRLLKVKAQADEGGQRRFVYEHTKSGDLFTVVDPGLRLDQLEAVQRDVAQLLEHGLEAPAVPPAAVPSGGEPAAQTGVSGDTPPVPGPGADAATTGGADSPTPPVMDAGSELVGPGGGTTGPV